MCDPLQPNRRDPFGKCFSFRKAGARKAKITLFLLRRRLSIELPCCLVERIRARSSEKAESE
jgi:hypothetical protein